MDGRALHAKRRLKFEGSQDARIYKEKGKHQNRGNALQLLNSS